MVAQETLLSVASHNFSWAVCYLCLMETPGNYWPNPTLYPVGITNIVSSKVLYGCCKAAFAVECSMPASRKATAVSGIPTSRPMMDAGAGQPTGRLYGDQELVEWGTCRLNGAVMGWGREQIMPGKVEEQDWLWWYMSNTEQSTFLGLICMHRRTQTCTNNLAGTGLCCPTAASGAYSRAGEQMSHYPEEISSSPKFPVKRNSSATTALPHGDLDRIGPCDLSSIPSCLHERWNEKWDLLVPHIDILFNCSLTSATWKLLRVFAESVLDGFKDRSN